MSANDTDVQHPEEPRPEKEAPTPDVPEWDPVAAFGEFPADTAVETDASAETPAVEASAAPAFAADVPVFEMPPTDFALEFEGSETVDRAEDGAEAVAPSAAEPAFEMPPADFALEFEGSAAEEKTVPTGENGAADAVEAVLEVPNDLPEWDPAAEFSPESFTESVPVEAPVVTETNVFTSLAPDPFDFSSIPEPVFETELLAETPEPAGPEGVPPVGETVTAIPAGDALGLERVLATIDAEVANSERRPAAPAVANAALGTSFVGFVHGSGRFAFSIEGITEITRSVRTTPVPFTPEWVVGVTNLRGDILAVADFGLMLGGGAVGSRDGAYMIVLQGKRTPFSLGLLVDAVTGMRTFGENEILTPTAPLGDRVTQFALGVTGAGAELTVVLDVEAFLALPEMQQFSRN
jgi:purine-binding chemotaxis protein CheW